ncbi:MAG: sortase [Patescibacteria group bacterium]
MRRFALLFAATVLAFLGTRAYVTHAKTLALASILVVEAPPSAPSTAPVTRAAGLMLTLRSREQFAPQILWFTEHLPEISLFPDVDQGNKEAPYIEVAFLEGIMRGAADGKFHPDAPLTVEQALVLISRTYGWTGGVPFQSSTALGNTEHTWFTEAVSEAIDRNLIPQEASLRLGTPLRHDDFAEILRRLRVAEEENTYAYIAEEESVLAQTPSSSPTSPSSPSSHPPLRVTPLKSTTISLPEVAPPTSPSLAYASTKYFAITIPKIGYNNIPVAHPDDPFTEKGMLEPLAFGAGHLLAYPGDGVSMIYVHSSAFPWQPQEFAKIGVKLDQLANGDRMYVTYAGKLHVYEVTSGAVVSPEDTSYLEDDGSQKMILYTCWPPNSTKSRLIKIGHPVETVALRES